MSWTDERIEQLKKLWGDGLSASQIASELGNVTRNAVIGKVHRLGLAGRAKSTAIQPQRQRKAAPPPRVAPATPVRVLSPTLVRGAVALKQEAILVAEAETMPALRMEDVVVAMSRRVSIMELKEGVCRFPLGDPMQPDFVYCGADCHVGTPYCGFHSRIAYQPNERRVREQPGR
jgi:GcrA cell cycle regulator